MNKTDFSQFETKEDLKEAMRRYGDPTNGADPIWHFVHDVRKGHTVVANRGRSHVVGIGIVESDYLPPADSRNPRRKADKHRHARRIDWVIDKVVDLPADFFIQRIPSAVLPLDSEQCAKLRQAYLQQYKGDTILKKKLDRVLPDEGLSVTLTDEDADDGGDAYDPTKGDWRKKVRRQIRARRGQRKFRDALRRRYGDRCVVTGCEILGLLEAAHINPYRGENDNHSENGLLLRADIHTLFDFNLLGIEPNRLQVELHLVIAKAPDYKELNGTALLCAGKKEPSVKALATRYELFRKKAKR